MKTQVDYFGNRLEQIVKTLDTLVAESYATRGDLSEAKRRAAESLGVSTRQLNRFLRRSGNKPRPQPILRREQASIQATERKRQQRLLALDVLYGRKTLTKAANLAGLHERSMRRVLDNLPIPARYPDYEHLTASTRYALAKNVEEMRDCSHLATLVNAQIHRKTDKTGSQTLEKPLILLMIGWLEGETDKYDPGFEHFLGLYGLKDVELQFWERPALADELRHLL